MRPMQESNSPGRGLVQSVGWARAWAGLGRGMGPGPKHLWYSLSFVFQGCVDLVVCGILKVGRLLLLHGADIWRSALCDPMNK